MKADRRLTFAVFAALASAGIALGLVACGSTSTPAHDFTITLDYDPLNTNPFDETWPTGSRSNAAIHEQMEYSRDCCPTTFRMWLKYYRNVAYRSELLFVDYHENQDAHFDSISAYLGDYSCLPDGLAAEYDGSAGYIAAIEPSPDEDSLDWTKYAFNTDDMAADFANYGTLVSDTGHDDDAAGYRDYETHLLYSAQFMGYLIEKQFMNAFDYGAVAAVGGWQKLDLAPLWADFALYYPYPEDGRLPSCPQSGQSWDHKLGNWEDCKHFPDFIASNDYTDFVVQLRNHFDYMAAPQYHDGNNYNDRALILLTKTDAQASALDELHFVLVTGMHGYIPENQALDWANAQITFRIEDPAESDGLPPWQASPAELEPYAAIDDPNTGVRLLYYRYLALTVGIPSRERGLSGAKGLDDIAQIDAEARVARYRENRRRSTFRKILPILMYLLGED